MSFAARSVLPKWVHDNDTLYYYVRNKYYVEPSSCDPLQDNKWLCHIECGQGCRIDSVFDLALQREITLPQTTAPYYLLPKWAQIVGLAFLPVANRWEFSFVALRLRDLQMDYIPLFSIPYQTITSFQFLPKHANVGFDMRYCLEQAGCWEDAFRLKRGKIVLKSHRRFVND